MCWNNSRAGARRRRTVAPLRNQIGFRAVSFAYQGVPDLLQSVTHAQQRRDHRADRCQWRRQDTLVHLLMRFIEPAAGAIFIDKPISPMPICQSLRRQVGYVPAKRC